MFRISDLPPRALNEYWIHLELKSFCVTARLKLAVLTALPTSFTKGLQEVDLTSLCDELFQSLMIALIQDGGGYCRAVEHLLKSNTSHFLAIVRRRRGKPAISIAWHAHDGVGYLSHHDDRQKTASDVQSQ